MNKKLLCVAAIAAGFMFSEVKAQTISVGPRLGLNFSSQAYDVDDEEFQEAYDDGKQMVSGIHAGIVFNIGINDMLSIQPEILYSQKGTGYEEKETFTMEDYGFEGSAAINYTETWNYLEVPVLAKLSFGSDMKFFVTAGPTFGYLMSGKSKSEAEFSGDVADFLDEEDYNDEDEMDFDEDESINRMDVGLSVGAGIGIPAGPGTFNLEGRYGLGLSNLYDGEGSEDFSVKNRTIGVSISYMIPIGG